MKVPAVARYSLHIDPHSNSIVDEYGNVVAIVKGHMSNSPTVQETNQFFCAAPKMFAALLVVRELVGKIQERLLVEDAISEALGVPVSRPNSSQS